MVMPCSYVMPLSTILLVSICYIICMPCIPYYLLSSDICRSQQIHRLYGNDRSENLFYQDGVDLVKENETSRNHVKFDSFVHCNHTQFGS